MEKILMLLFCHIATSVKHSLNIYSTISFGHPNIPGYMVVADFEEVQMTYYEGSMKIPEPRQDWVRKFMEDDPKEWDALIEYCISYEPMLINDAGHIKQLSNQAEGLHIIQLMMGCEWDSETQMIAGFFQYGYNGDNLLTFDPQTLTWIAANPQAETIKQEWNGDAAKNQLWRNGLDLCPQIVGICLKHAGGFPHRKDLPSVSFLQKTPSSPVSCHATGFYPHRAVMFWTRDGEELYEDVDHGEILPNHDGTFQMSVDLDVSSVKAEDWRRYDCVFQLSGVKDDIVTKLDEAHIRTNMEKSSDTTIAIVVAVVVLVVILICSVVGFKVYKKKTAELPALSPGDSELTLTG